MTFVLILYFDWLQGPHIGQNFEKHSKIFFSETVKGIKPVLCIHVRDSGLYIIYVFYSRRIRTLVAMATLSFHRLIHVPDSGLYIICVFYSRRIRTLVAMAT